MKTFHFYLTLVLIIIIFQSRYELYAFDPNIIINENFIVNIKQNNPIRFANTQTLIAPVLEDFQVNENSGGCEHNYPVTAIDNHGKFVVVWEDYRNGNADIYAQLYYKNGVKRENNFRVNDDDVCCVQMDPEVAMDSSGNFVVVWADERNGNYDIYAQCYNNFGVKEGVNFRVNDVTDNIDFDQYSPIVAMNNTGNFIIVWHGAEGFCAQRFSAIGIRNGSNFKINNHDLGSAHSPSIAMADNGTFVVVWISTVYPKAYTTQHGIFGQYFNIDNQQDGENFQVKEFSLIETYLYLFVGIDNSGNFVISWEVDEYQLNSIYFQRFDSNCRPISDNFLVTSIDEEGTCSAFAMNANGNFVIAWNEYPIICAQHFTKNGKKNGIKIKVTDKGRIFRLALDDAGNFVVVWSQYTDIFPEIFCRSYNNSGKAQNDQFKVNDDSLSGNQDYPRIFIDGNQNFFINWREIFDPVGQLFYINGTKSGSPVQFDDESPAIRDNLALSMDFKGNFVVAWEDERMHNNDIHAQLYFADGAKKGWTFLLSDDSNGFDQNRPLVAVADNGNFVVVWRDERNGKTDIYAQYCQADGTLIGSNFQVNENLFDDNIYFLAISMNGRGDFVVIWNVSENIYGQLYQAYGIKKGVNFQINTERFQGRNNTVAMDDSGNFVVVWEEDSYSKSGIYALRFGTGGIKLDSCFKVDDDCRCNLKQYPVAAFNDFGNFVIIWEDYRNGYYKYYDLYHNPDIYAQLYDSQGNAIGKNYRVNNDLGTKSQLHPDVKFVNNYIYYTWQDNRIAGQGYDIFARIDEFKPTAVEEPNKNNIISSRFQLFQNFPNPFNPNTSIRYLLPDANQVTLKIYNISGQEIKTLVESNQEAGEHFVEWDGMLSNGEIASSGIYYCQLKVGNEVQVRKMVLAR